jgi:hypothetical protein
MSAGGRLCTLQGNPRFWVQTIKVRPPDGTRILALPSCELEDRRRGPRDGRQERVNANVMPPVINVGTGGCPSREISGSAYEFRLSRRHSIKSTEPHYSNLPLEDTRENVEKKKKTNIPDFLLMMDINKSEICSVLYIVEVVYCPLMFLTESDTWTASILFKIRHRQ